MILKNIIKKDKKGLTMLQLIGLIVILIVFLVIMFVFYKYATQGSVGWSSFIKNLFRSGGK